MHLIKGFGRTDDVSTSGMSDCLSALKTNYLLSVDATTDFTVPWKNGSSQKDSSETGYAELLLVLKRTV